MYLAHLQKPPDTGGCKVGLGRGPVRNETGGMEARPEAQGNHHMPSGHWRCKDFFLIFTELSYSLENGLRQGTAERKGERAR